MSYLEIQKKLKKNHGCTFCSESVGREYSQVGKYHLGHEVWFWNHCHMFATQPSTCHTEGAQLTFAG